jgi:peptidoglycan/xylan/chitin deacetylase (PgdA/CDA1 family)
LTADLDAQGPYGSLFMKTIIHLKTRPTSVRRQDLAPLFLYYLGFPLIRNWILRLFKVRITKILAFHDVPDDLAPRFRAQVEYLRKHANVVSLDDLFAGRLSYTKINVVITFDDGYQSWIHNVSPVLVDLGVTGTFFSSSGFIPLQGIEETNYLQNNLRSNIPTTGAIGIDGLRKLAENGFAIGGHTINHADLSIMSDANEVLNEIGKDKEDLELITKTKIDYFAYPFGFYKNPHINLMQMLQRTGYQGAVTLEPGPITNIRSNYDLPRYLVNAAMPMPVFKARFLGGYDGVLFIRRLLKWLFGAFYIQ